MLMELAASKEVVSASVTDLLVEVEGRLMSACRLTEVFLA
jgi:hypothetical protein